MIKAVLISLLVAVGLIFSPVGTFAQSDNVSADNGAKTLNKGGSLIPDCIKDEGSRTASGQCVEDSIVFYTNILLVVVAIGAFIYMLYGAFLYASAFGDESKIGQAKKTITHAIIGVVLAGMSALLVQLLKSALNFS